MPTSLLMPIAEAAAALGVTESAIYKATVIYEADPQYGLRFVWFGGRKYIPREVVEQVAKEGVAYPVAGRKGRPRKGSL